MATWTSDTTDSSTGTSRSSRYNLDEHDKREVLVYRPRCGLQVQSMESLCQTVNKGERRGQYPPIRSAADELRPSDPRLRVSRKHIPRGNSRVEVRNEDLYNEPERSEYQKYPNIKSSLANIGLPSMVYWKRLLLGQFPDLYIVSPETTPTNSPSSSPESSQHVSPQHTFPINDQKNATSAGEEGRPGDL